MVAVGVVAITTSIWIWVARARYWLNEADRWALQEQLEMREAIDNEQNAAWARVLVARGEKQAGLQPTALAARTFEAVASAHKMRAKEFARIKNICKQRILYMISPDYPLPGKYIDVGEFYRQAVESYYREEAEANHER
jgi:hypothetical protein